jgi:diphthamide synthase (EF-2-diphthine--ammonia ligase)
MEVRSQPSFLDSYRANITALREQHGVCVLATGDILDVCSSFMPRAAAGTGVQLLSPLWGIPRRLLLELVWAYGMTPLITCVNTTKFVRRGATEAVAPAAGGEGGGGEGGGGQGGLLDTKEARGGKAAGDAGTGADGDAGRAAVDGGGASVRLGGVPGPEVGSEGEEALRRVVGSGQRPCASVTPDMRDPAATAECSGSGRHASTKPSSDGKEAGGVGSASACGDGGGEVGSGGPPRQGAEPRGLEGGAALLGSRLDRQLYDEVLVPARELYGIDECGEWGEYHTMVTASRLFAAPLSLSFTTRREGDYAFLAMLPAVSEAAADART